DGRLHHAVQAGPGLLQGAGEVIERLGGLHLDGVARVAQGGRGEDEAAHADRLAVGSLLPVKVQVVNFHQRVPPLVIGPTIKDSRSRVQWEYSSMLKNPDKARSHVDPDP